jgi:translation elongation factor EF-1alpha
MDFVIKIIILVSIIMILAVESYVVWRIWNLIQENAHHEPKIKAESNDNIGFEVKDLVATDIKRDNTSGDNNNDLPKRFPKNFIGEIHTKYTPNNEYYDVYMVCRCERCLQKIRNLYYLEMRQKLRREIQEIMFIFLKRRTMSKSVEKNFTKE